MNKKYLVSGSFVDEASEFSSFTSVSHLIDSFRPIPEIEKSSDAITAMKPGEIMVFDGKPFYDRVVIVCYSEIKDLTGKFLT